HQQDKKEVKRRKMKPKDISFISFEKEALMLEKEALILENIELREWKNVGRELADKILLHFNGKRPYLVINHLGRSKIDVNRPIKEGVDGKDSITLIAWNDYHNFIQTAIKDVETNFGQGLLIDIHGHGHPENFIEIGYVLSAGTLSLSTSQINEDPEIYSGSSIRSLYTRNSNGIRFSDLLYGKTTSLGGRLQSYGYDAVPSHIHKHPLKDEKYFRGGYCAQKYGSLHAEHVIDAMQI
ncbi:17731_t:CDS:2, partial [Gigaspora margarita]